MNSNKIREIVSLLGNKKRPFLDDIESSINRYISKQGAECVCIIERYSSGSGVYKRWPIAASMDYVTVAKRFCYGQKYNGHELDSALTDPVVGIVTEKFEKFYASQSEDISKAVLSIILEDKVFSKSFIRTIIDSTSAHYVRDYIKDQAVDTLLNQMHLTLAHSTAHIAASTVAKTVAGVLIKVILLNFKAIVIKVLGTAAIKLLITVAVKKFIVVAIVTMVSKFLLAKLGAVFAAHIAFFILPIIAAFIAYEVVTFPEHLGKKVSEQVRYDLDDNFSEINTSIIEKIVEEMISAEAEKLGSAIANSKEIQEAIDKLIKSL